MKSPRYTAGVVSIYRKYVDYYLEHGRDGYKVDPADRKMLLDLFDRGGQTLGYYIEHNGRDMVVCHEKPAFRQENREPVSGQNVCGSRGERTGSGVCACL